MHEWADFVAAMLRDPCDCVLMGAASDWLQEQGDVRWEALAWLAENGRVGVEYGADVLWRGRLYFTCDEKSSPDFRPGNVCSDWWNAAYHQFRVTSCFREAFLDAYAAATPTVRAEWLAASL